MKKYFICGISTGVGKTIASAILTNALEADYWKPIQSGTIEGSDSEIVKKFVTNKKSQVHKESYSFKTPVSPHLAAEIENTTIKIDNLKLPDTQNENLIIEGAGGLLVPINNSYYIIDLAKYFDAEVILVCGDYLGCINHSLLSLEYLISKKFRIKGIILNGNFEKQVKEKIINYANIPLLFEIPRFSEINHDNISCQISILKKKKDAILLNGSFRKR